MENLDSLLKLLLADQQFLYLLVFLQQLQTQLFDHLHVLGNWSQFERTVLFTNCLSTSCPLIRSLKSLVSLTSCCLGFRTNLHFSQCFILVLSQLAYFIIQNVVILVVLSHHSLPFSPANHLGMSQTVLLRRLHFRVDSLSHHLGTARNSRFRHLAR